MDELGRSLRSFGLDPERVFEALRRGDISGILDSLEKEENMLRLRSVEMADLREQLLALAEEGKRRLKDEILDEEMEMLSAAGQEPKNIP
jgi:hypothetical protein